MRLPTLPPKLRTSFSRRSRESMAAAPTAAPPIAEDFVVLAGESSAETGGSPQNDAAFTSPWTIVRERSFPGSMPQGFVGGPGQASATAGGAPSGATRRMLFKQPESTPPDRRTVENAALSRTPTFRAQDEEQGTPSVSHEAAAPLGRPQPQQVVGKPSTSSSSAPSASAPLAPQSAPAARSAPSAPAVAPGKKTARNAMPSAPSAPSCNTERTQETPIARLQRAAALLATVSSSSAASSSRTQAQARAAKATMDAAQRLSARMKLTDQRRCAEHEPDGASMPLTHSAAAACSHGAATDSAGEGELTSWEKAALAKLTSTAEELERVRHEESSSTHQATAGSSTHEATAAAIAAGSTTVSADDSIGGTKHCAHPRRAPPVSTALPLLNDSHRSQSRIPSPPPMPPPPPPPRQRYSRVGYSYQRDGYQSDRTSAQYLHSTSPSVADSLPLRRGTLQVAPALEPAHLEGVTATVGVPARGTGERGRTSVTAAEVYATQYRELARGLAVEAEAASIDDEDDDGGDGSGRGVGMGMAAEAAVAERASAKRAAARADEQARRAARAEETDAKARAAEGMVAAAPRPAVSAARLNPAGRVAAAAVTPTNPLPADVGSSSSLDAPAGVEATIAEDDLMARTLWAALKLQSRARGRSIRRQLPDKEELHYRYTLQGACTLTRSSRNAVNHKWS